MQQNHTICPKLGAVSKIWAFYGTPSITCEGLDLLVVKVVFPQEDLNAGLHAEGAEQPQTLIPVLEALACTPPHSVPTALDPGCLPVFAASSVPMASMPHPQPTSGPPAVCWENSADTTCKLQIDRLH